MALFTSKKTSKDTAKAKPEKKEAKVDQKKKSDKAKEAEISMKDLYQDKATSAPSGKKATKSVAKYRLETNLLISPLVTEKATTLASSNKYAFVVANNSNKISVAKAVEAVYGVKPIAVNIINMKGKAVSRGRIKGRRKDWKKAIVTLAKGETISIYEGV